MTVLDAYAVIALMAGEGAGAEVAELLRQADPTITSVNAAEVIDVMVRVRGHAAASVTERIELLVAAGLAIVAVDVEAGYAAGILRAAHYVKGTSELSLADCIALAAAQQLGHGLATSDAPLASAARAEGISVVGLPDSSGARP